MTLGFLMIFPALLIAAAVYDLSSMTIPNWLSGLVAISFFPVAFALGMPLAEIGNSLLVATGVLLVTMSFFGFGWFGGGDAKLLTASSLWVGASMFPFFILYVCILGGVATLAILAFRRMPLVGFAQGQAWLERLHRADEGVPYGVAICGAGLLACPMTPLFQMVTG